MATIIDATLKTISQRVKTLAQNHAANTKRANDLQSELTAVKLALQSANDRATKAESSLAAAESSLANAPTQDGHSAIAEIDATLKAAGI
jgi:chromosome segregation ATPase